MNEIVVRIPAPLQSFAEGEHSRDVRLQCRLAGPWVAGLKPGVEVTGVASRVDAMPLLASRSVNA